MGARVTWHGGMTLTGTADSGFTVPMGAAPAVGGDNDGFRPMELMAMSLAGCTAMDVISIMRKKRQDVTAFAVSVEAEQADEHPKVFTSAVILYEVTGHDISENALQRSIGLSAKTYCPAQGMLAKAMSMRLTYRIYEGESVDDRTLVVEGEWTEE